MELSHFHIGVSDIRDVVDWFHQKADLAPSFSNHRLAYFDFGSTTTVFEEKSTNQECTLAFRTSNCEFEYEKYIKSGCESISPPSTKKWGVKSAYIKGPGNIIVEIEEKIGD